MWSYRTRNVLNVLGTALFQLSDALQRAEHFGNAPRLRDAAARRVRGLCIRDLTHRPDTRLTQVPVECVQRRTRGSYAIRIGFQPGVHERSDQPRPDRPLVIRGVPAAKIA